MQTLVRQRTASSCVAKPRNRSPAHRSWSRLYHRPRVFRPLSPLKLRIQSLQRRWNIRRCRSRSHSVRSLAPFGPSVALRAGLAQIRCNPRGVSRGQPSIGSKIGEMTAFCDSERCMNPQRFRKAQWVGHAIGCSRRFRGVPFAQVLSAGQPFAQILSAGQDFAACRDLSA